MKSEKLEEGGVIEKAACLARNSYTKNISLEVSSSEIVYDQKTSILTSEGSYNAIKVFKVAKGTEVTCTAEFSGTAVNSTLPGTILWSSCNLFLEAMSSSTCCSSSDAKVEKANMLSMAVVGLRVLLAKTIAFNTLMSIKLFLF
ncbi:TRDC protein, partial [Steatornis caripensis]|nr:TRDC protein [Steatornis caripensis]